MTKICDHTSVGVIITGKDGALALLKRALFPVGIAPPAGHIDDHGSAEQAAIDEVSEEIGLRIAIGDLKPTAVQNRRIDNQCRREDGTYHMWSVYEVTRWEGDIRPDPEETKGAAWYSHEQVQALADRTRLYQAGKIPEAEWQAEPGFEPIWLDFLMELGYVKA